MPPAGASGQHLAKASATDYDAVWVNVPSSVPPSRQVLAGGGLTGGGDLSADRTLSMPNVGTPGAYGDATHVPVITTDAQGRVSAVVTAAIPTSPPGGTTGQVQYNNAGALGGAAGVVYAAAGPHITITAQAAGARPLVVKGAASQTVNLTEWQDATSAVLAAVSPAGKVGIGQTPVASLHFATGASHFIGFENQGATDAGILWKTTGTIDDTGTGLTNGFRLYHKRSDGADNIYLSAFNTIIGERIILSADRGPGYVGINGAYVGSVADVQFFQSSGSTRPIVGAGSNVAYTAPAVRLLGYSADGINGGAGLEVGDGSGAVACRLMRDTGNNFIVYATTPAAGNLTFNLKGSHVVTTRTATAKPLVVQGAAAQTANLQDWQNSSGTPLAWVDSAGKFNGDGSLLTGIAAGSLTSSTALCSADQALSTTSVDIPGCSLTLAAGTYLLLAEVQLNNSGAASNTALLRIYNSTDSVNIAAATVSITNAFAGHVTLCRIATIAATKTFKLAAKQYGGTFTVNRFGDGAEGTPAIPGTALTAVKIA